METLLALDQALFSVINQDLSNPTLDAIMPYWREKTTWIPLYIVIIVFAFRQWSWKVALSFLLFIAATVGIADQVSSQWIKKSVERTRPCKAEALAEDIHLLIPCGSGYSFTSSHATNHFAVGIFIMLTLLKNKSWRWLMLAWAGSIALGQVYVGVHYPLDIFVGGVIGSLIGYGMVLGFGFLVGRLSFGV
ncbi:MAG: phosphatase PAP2 family protein [Bacteroidota bacterium]